MKLLTTGNQKIAKGLKLGYLTNILHLAPSDMSGHNVCPMATPGCKSACLNTAGRGGLFTGKSHLNMTGAQLVSAVKSGSFSNVIQKARIARTNWFFNDRPSFMRQLYREIVSAEKLALKHNLIPVFRLNGTSDIRWEHMSIVAAVRDGKKWVEKTWPNVMAAFPDIQFYDYTKLYNRTTPVFPNPHKQMPKNYHLTFSLAENNDDNARKALVNGMNVAVVFRTKNLPATYLGKPVINGDENDLRFLDPKGVIVGLKAKGKGKKDTTGFVRDA